MLHMVFALFENIQRKIPKKLVLYLEWKKKKIAAQTFDWSLLWWKTKYDAHNDRRFAWKFFRFETITLQNASIYQLNHQSNCNFVVVVQSQIMYD